MLVMVPFAQGVFTKHSRGFGGLPSGEATLHGGRFDKGYVGVVVDFCSSGTMTLLNPA
ncbi:hypothetical protein KEF85_07135 [Methylomonas paludis]|uniref:Uncharacterized protein n=1 Tax=Methylomonas paludis TaxID=1173101 RepID=A0A975RBF0_9GAMM|nr:hypothetical protein [Methylomonas paludis]QWF72216.1 hypothetical protein KEF85_07135 [Methylomonas paludis]